MQAAEDLTRGINVQKLLNMVAKSTRKARAHIEERGGKERMEIFMARRKQQRQRLRQKRVKRDAS
jgi:hypothetical protein